MLRAIGMLMASRTPQTSFDADAQAFFTATGITDNTIKNAINTLVLSLKSASLWTNALLLYPLVGGTSATCAVNLRNPGSNVISWTGTLTFASTGVKPTAASSYGDTGVNDNTLTFNASAIGVYSRTQGGDGWDCGVDFTGPASQNSMTLSRSTINAGRLTAYWFLGFDQAERDVTAGASTQGLYTVTAGGTTKLYRNTTDVSEFNASNTNSPSNNTILFGATRGTASFSNREYAFFFLYNQNLSSTNVTNLYNAIQAFQTALSRQV